MSFKFIVTLDGIEKMRGGLTQATLYLITLYGSVDAGISAGVKIRPEWLTTPLIPKPQTASNLATNLATQRPPRLSNNSIRGFPGRVLSQH